MVNKKGWLRIIEATIAILMVFSALIIVYSNLNPPEPRKDTIDISLSSILENVAKNLTLRDRILSYNTTSDSIENNETKALLAGSISEKIKDSTINFDLEICDADKICYLKNETSLNSEIYADSRLIASNLTSFSPKQIKLFVWRNV